MPDQLELSELLRRSFRAHRPQGRSELGDDTNFFEAGYTSVLLTAVLADLVTKGVELTLVDMFRHPTMRLLQAEAARRHGVPDPSPTADALPWEQP
ncbi:acyl carrier protein [Streptomyces sp. NPDC007856]|uniref:acyl carrier protein n=1 Tax=Streptomyces sp. NPDC007856 TaxID=3364781 RepID=UPI0036A9D29A